MAYECDNCGKGVDYGHDVSHAKNRTKRTRKPNLHAAWVMKDGKKVKGLFCTKCLRRVDRVGKKAVSEEKTKKATSTAAV